ncbi:MAG: MYXO-CTERM sorting domain-containing protein, partial [Kofleriaceae bacterium]
RVSLAADRASLPPDPAGDVVSTGPGNKECTSLAINPNPTLPLLADGLLVKATGTMGPRTMQVTLPAGMTCDHCVLQVVEFMSNHPASCFYHHCANIKISTNGPAGGVDAGMGGGGIDAGPVGGGGSDAGVGGGSSGGGCSVASKDVTGVALALAVGLVLARRRRRR